MIGVRDRLGSDGGDDMSSKRELLGLYEYFDDAVLR